MNTKHVITLTMVSTRSINQIEDLEGKHFDVPRFAMNCICMYIHYCIYTQTDCDCWCVTKNSCDGSFLNEVILSTKDLLCENNTNQRNMEEKLERSYV